MSADESSRPRPQHRDPGGSYTTERTVTARPLQRHSTAQTSIIGAMRNALTVFSAVLLLGGAVACSNSASDSTAGRKTDAAASEPVSAGSAFSRVRVGHCAHRFRHHRQRRSASLHARVPGAVAHRANFQLWRPSTQRTSCGTWSPRQGVRGPPRRAPIGRPPQPAAVTRDTAPDRRLTLNRWRISIQEPPRLRLGSPTSGRMFT